MNKEQGITIQRHRRNSADGMNRRELVRRLMLAGGTGFAMAGITETDLADKPALNPKGSTQTGANSAMAEWTPKFLDSHQNETIIVLAERIIPGSGRANVNRFIDLLLSVDTPDAQKRFIASLSAFDAESLQRYSHPYKDLTEAAQTEILSSASRAKPEPVLEGLGQRGTMRDHFENIKKWVFGAYYSSEIGMKEMGWTGQVYFASFPGCQQSEN